MILRTEDGKVIDLSKGVDLSIPLSNDFNNPRAWYVNPPRFEPVINDDWVGSVEKGGSVNFRDIYFNPHGHGTHTECLGHITPKVHSINKHLQQFFFKAVVLSVKLTSKGDDLVIEAKDLEFLRKYTETEALILRTLPNETSKLTRNYSASNPPYLDISCLDIMNQLNVKHLLVDLPSVDKELDGGVLAFHHGFWEVPDRPRFDRTITEMIYVPDMVPDGEYLLNLQVAPFENDAAPSRPVIYPMM